MRKYVVRKILSSILTIVLVMTLNFLLIHLAPGDPVSVLMGPDSNDPELRAAMMAKFGLDKPIVVQYLNYLKQLFTGDLGDSIIFQRRASAGDSHGDMGGQERRLLSGHHLLVVRIRAEGRPIILACPHANHPFRYKPEVVAVVGPDRPQSQLHGA